eukprot:TRINITY_DN16774_c0_g1_i1.p1 TRINITY_DN16774_c0_g1~~TRINITY_DN16774_c0_g1_i1.p1  ORF type:complete len:239 (-),score=37.81 TRINITY_DN16774_c0_g1_i1:91-807(-)
MWETLEIDSRKHKIVAEQQRTIEEIMEQKLHAEHRWQEWRSRAYIEKHRRNILEEHLARFPSGGEDNNVSRTHEKVSRREHAVLNRLLLLLAPRNESFVDVQEIWNRGGVLHKLQELERYAVDRDVEAHRMQRKLSKLHNQTISLTAQLASARNSQVQAQWLSTLRDEAADSPDVPRRPVSPNRRRSASRWLEESPELSQLQGVPVEEVYPRPASPRVVENMQWQSSLREDSYYAQWD